MGYRILVVDTASAPSYTEIQSALADRADFTVQRLAWEHVDRETLAIRRPHAVVAVAVPHTAEVTAALERLSAQPLAMPVVVILPAQPESPLLRLTASTTDDFLLAPVRREELHERLRRVLAIPSEVIADVHERLVTEMGLTQLVGRDPSFLRAIEQIPRFARSSLPVLITGETGTGKEMCARAVHYLGRRRPFPFVAVDCAAIPDHLFENEVFGHVRGAFTDAHRDQKGVVAMAKGGTLFLDEIDSISLATQAKLLRFLENNSYRPLGSDRFVKANVNVIAATNRDLEKAVDQGSFRSDLYFRLNVLRLHLPPLRERRKDIPLLARHFLEAESGPRKSLSPSALQKLDLYDWPGNVRELSNVVRRAALLSEGTCVPPTHVTIRTVLADDGPARPSFRQARAGAIASFERAYLIQLLHQHSGNVTRAAQAAGKERRAFGRLIKKYGLNRHDPL